MGELKLLDIFFKTALCSMISTDALQGGFLSSFTIVNEGTSLPIVNERTSLKIVNETARFIKTIILQNELFKKRSVLESIVSFLFFFVVVFITKLSFFLNENVNIPKWIRALF